MELYFLKQKALDYLKANMDSLYINYYRERTNDWIKELFDYDPFEVFMTIPDFELMPINDKKGELDLENCKILFSKLINLSESQASDERLWAGLCNSTFYNYVRLRWNYPNMKFKTPEKDSGAILSRFFFSGGTRSGFYRNTLAKYWWVGHGTYQATAQNKFELLDALGPDDFSTKVTDLFYSNTFASNPTITKGICSAWKIFSDRGIKLPTREYFRPALQYLNALGGGILLDVLSEEEIKDVFFDFIHQLHSKDKPKAVIIEDYSDDDNEEETETIIVNSDIDNIQKAIVQKIEDDVSANEGTLNSNVKFIGTDEKPNVKDAEKLNAFMGKPEKVEFGCKVILHKQKADKIVGYIIPKADSKETWYSIQKFLLNKKIGDTIFCAGDTYEVIDISW